MKFGQNRLKIVVAICKQKWVKRGAVWELHKRLTSDASLLCWLTWKVLSSWHLENSLVNGWHGDVIKCKRREGKGSLLWVDILPKTSPTLFNIFSLWLSHQLWPISHINATCRLIKGKRSQHATLMCVGEFDGDVVLSEQQVIRLLLLWVLKMHWHDVHKTLISRFTCV